MGSELFTVVTVSRAREMLAAYLPQELRGRERCSLLDALGRRLAVSLLAGENVPGFDRSTVDGYAVRARDTFGASEGLPAYFEVPGEVRMGFPPPGELTAGSAMAVPTGGMLPQGADAVVMVEHTERAGGGIEVTRPVGPGENVITSGEDLKQGEEVLPANHRLRPQDLGYLAALGVMEVEVFAPLRVGIISTGDELVSPEQQPSPGQVRDVNSYAIYGLVQMLGGQARLYGIVRDQPELLEQKLSLALGENDLVIVSGGSSVGTRDHTARIMSELGSPGLVFHGLAVRPGKPTLGGVVAGKPVFGLPGHPAAAMISFDLMVAPLLKCGGYKSMSGGAAPIKALISRSLGSAPGREEFIRVRLRRDEKGVWADPVLGKSGLLTPMVQAEGLVRIPLESEGVAAGDPVDVYLFSSDYLL